MFAFERCGRHPISDRDIPAERTPENYSRHELCARRPQGDQPSGSHHREEGSMYRRLDQVARDLRFALRQFRRAPGLTFAAFWR